MFKRLLLLSGLIAFLLACALMYFWYLPNHSAAVQTTGRTEKVQETTVEKLDTVQSLMLQE